jgi:hypothetical protein
MAMTPTTGTERGTSQVQYDSKEIERRQKLREQLAAKGPLSSELVTAASAYDLEPIALPQMKPLSKEESPFPLTEEPSSGATSAASVGSQNEVRARPATLRIEPPNEEVALVRSLLQSHLVEYGFRAAQVLAQYEPNPEVLATLTSATKNDPSKEVRIAVTDVVEEWCRSDGGVKAIVEGLLLAIGCKKTDDCRFSLHHSLIRFNISHMDLPSDREKRINTVASHIRREVATELSDPEEQREAEAKALVTSVPKEADFREQLRSFTGITHVMRVMMARQLEPKFKKHLRENGPKVEPESTLPERKKTFAEEITDGLYRLGIGLGIKLNSREETCYVSVAKSDRQRLGFYKIVPCGQTNAVKTLAGWSEAQIAMHQKTVKDAVSTFVEQIRLVDAAAPGDRNHLSPKRKTHNTL